MLALDVVHDLRLARAEYAATAWITAERDALAGAVRSAVIVVLKAIRRLQ